MTHKKLSARILSLVLTAAMVGTMMPSTVLAAEGDAALGTSSIETTTRTITAFDELGEDYTKSVPFDGHTYAVTVKLGTPIEEIVLPTELGVTVEKTTTTTPPAKDEVQDDVVDSGEAPKDTAPADEPTAEPEDKPVVEAPVADESASSEPAAQTADTDTTVSDNKPASPSDAEPAPAPEEKPDADVPPVDEPDTAIPPVDEPEQDKETTVTETTQETISVTWKGDRDYTPDQNSKVIYTAVLPEGYTLADGVALPTIYVMVGMQARAGAVTEQFNLPIGETYYFDLSGEAGNIGNINTEVPDVTLHYVPFTYAGTVNAYSLDSSSSGKTGASVEAAKTPSDRSLFVADYVVGISTIAWNTLNTNNLIFGKTFDEKYKLRTLSGGSSKSGSSSDGSDHKGIPNNNEWDSILSKSGLTNPIKNFFEYFSWMQDTTAEADFYRSLRGRYKAVAFWIDSDYNADSNLGFRPALEVLNPTTLGNTGLKAVMLNLNGGTFNSASSINIVCAGGTFKAPSATGLTRPTGNADTGFGWNTALDGSGTSYAAGDLVPNSVTTLYAQWKELGPSIAVAAQSSTATYGTATSPTFVVTGSSFGGLYPTFAPEVEWVGAAPAGVTAAFNGTNNETLTMTTTATTPAGEYKFKVVSAKADSGNYESAEATLTVDKREATITWGSITSFPYNGSVQAPTATISNKVSGDAVTVTVIGGQTNVGTGYTATASALAGAAAGNYKLPTTKPTTTFAITAITVTVTDGTLEVKKPFDNSTSAGTVTSGKLGLTGVETDDADNVSVKVDTVGAYADANVGKNKTVTLTISLEGSAAGNYTLDSVTTYSFAKAEITKVAYGGTPASAPDSTPASNGDKSITIKPVTPPNGENVEYAVSKTNTAPTSDSDWQTSTTFDNLDPNTEYFFFARVKENDNHAAGGVSSPGTSITTDKSEYTTKPTKPDETPDSKSDTSITLKTVTPPDGETLQYGIEKPEGTINWQDGTTFSPLSPNTDYKFYTRVNENDKHKAGPASDATTIKTDLSDAQKVAAAKKAVTDALDKFTPTNATDADAVMAAVNKALTDAGITGVTPSWDVAFNKNEATEEATGKVTGTVKLTCGAASDTVAFDKTIAKLPSDPAEKIRTVKAAIEAALNAYTATNATTADDIKAIVDKANTDSGVKTVTVAWGTPGFSNTNSTNSADGKVTGKFDLSCTSGGSTANGTVSFDRPIDRSDEQKLAGAILDANAAMNGIATNNASSPSSVSSGTKYVSDAEMKALTDAIAAAQAVVDKTNPAATDAELIAAANALNNAVAAFNAAIKTGTYTSGGGGGGGGGGSSSGGGSTLPPTKPTEPVTGNSNTNATVDNKGNATVNVTDKNISDAVKAAQDAANKKGVNAGEVTAVINVKTPANSNPNTVSVNLPKTVQQDIISNKIGNVAIVIDKPDISIGMTLATITEMNKQANADIQISATRTDATKLSTEAKNAIGSRPAFDLKATFASGSKSITNFGAGTVTIAIPYTLQKGEIAGGLYAIYVDDKGKANYLTNSSYDAEAKVLRFATNHFSVYGIGYKAPMNFTDIVTHWAKTDIEFVVNRGLMSGTSNTTFAPNTAMTRGMFVTALGRLAGIDTNSYKTSKFTDVKADAYYAPYVNWAATKGIVKGTTATTFAPDQAITRQEMATIMSSYAKAMGYTVPETRAAVTFADNGSIASWAAPAVKQMQMAGILNGKNSNTFDPTGTATRGEISAMFHRYVELVIDRTTTEGWTQNDSGSSLYYKDGKAVTGTQTIGSVAYNFNGYGETTRKTMTAGATTDPALPTNGKKYITHKIVKGDTLWNLAQKHGTTVNAIVALNGIKDRNAVPVGTEIKIPQK